MEAIIDKDISAVEALLCPEFQDSHPELDKEIHDMFYLIDGDIVSYDESIYAISGGTTAEGEYVERYVEPGIRNIRTSTGKTYSIYFVYYIVNNEHPKLLGICNIHMVLEEDDENPTLGYGFIEYHLDA